MTKDQMIKTLLAAIVKIKAQSREPHTRQIAHVAINATRGEG